MDFRHCSVRVAGLLSSEAGRARRLKVVGNEHRQSPAPRMAARSRFRLGKLALADGDRARAQEYLRRSGYKSFDKPVVPTTPFSGDTLSGYTFAPHRIAEHTCRSPSLRAANRCPPSRRSSPGLPWACEVSSCSADQGAAAVTVADTQSKLLGRWQNHHALGQRPLQANDQFLAFSHFDSESA